MISILRKHERAMTFSRKRLVLFAALILAALVIVGFIYAHSQKSDNASPAPAASSGSSAADVKSVHSPGLVAIDEQLAAGQCKAVMIDAAAGEYLPDLACTPGSADPAVTEDNLDSTICKSGYTSTVRPATSDTDKVKAQSLREYGQTAAKTTEYDHLISLELGGSNSVSNLWPQPNKTGATGTTNPKDTVENTLHTAVCSHKVTLAAAQKAIAHNWVTAEKDLGL